MVARKCECCGTFLDDNDVMKIILEDGSSETFPLPTCPKCFGNELIKKKKS